MNDENRFRLRRQIIAKGIFLLSQCEVLLPLEDQNSEEEEERTVPWPRRIPYRIRNFIEDVVHNYSEREFQGDFRINKRTFEQLVPLVEDIIKKESIHGRPQIDTTQQLLAVIWLLATPDSYRSVGQRFNMGKASLSDSFVRIIKALNILAPKVIKWPENTAEAARRFGQIAGLEGVIGAIDGTYIVIKAPKNDPQAYITRKMDYAITLQAVCDASLKYIDCFVGYPGSVSDTRIFRNSDIYHNVNANYQRYFPNNEFIVADKAYPVLPWVMPPYINRGNLNREQLYFNAKICQTRQVIERSFALLFGRFRRLRYLDMNRHDLIPQTVLAACVLHNMCIDNGDVLINEYVQEGFPHVRGNDEMEPVVINNNINRHNQLEGQRIRNDLCHQLFTHRR